MLSQNFIDKAELVSKYAQEYCLKVGKNDVKPKELLPFLVEKGVYDIVDQRNGSYLRELLRALDDENELYRIPQLYFERKDINRLWFFKAV